MSSGVTGGGTYWLMLLRKEEAVKVLPIHQTSIFIALLRLLSQSLSLST